LVEEIKTGTTTIGVIFKDGVVLAADSRASMGHLAFHEETQKVYKLSDKLGLAIAGSVGDALMLVRFLRNKTNLFEIEHEGKMTPTALATFLSNLLNANRFYPFLVQFIIGGINTEPMLFDIDPSGGLLPRKDYTVSGSGTELALSALDQHYKPNMTEDEAVNLAVKVINQAKKRDNFSGGVIISLMVISKNGVKEQTIKDLKKFLKK
jgi:proteasome beta subunit